MIYSIVDERCIVSAFAITETTTVDVVTYVSHMYETFMYTSLLCL